MKTIVSKLVVSRWSDYPIIYDDVFRRIRESPPFNESAYTQDEDTGKPKKNVLRTPTTFGPNDRQHNPGAGMGDDRELREQKAKGVGSGYNDGEHANDETGPGYTEITPDPYYTSDVFNELFLDLNLKAGDRDKIRSTVNRMDRSRTVPLPHRRFPVL